MVSGKVHFSRPPRLVDLGKSIASGSRVFYMPKSCFERLSAKARKLLDSAGAEVMIQAVRGRPLQVGPQMLSEIVEMHKDNRTFRQIEAATGVPKSTAHYLIRYAERQKIKHAGKVVYL